MRAGRPARPPRAAARPAPSRAARSTTGGRPPRCSCTTCAHSEPESSSRVSPSSSDRSSGGDEAGRRTARDVVDHAEHRDHRRRQDRGLAGLVVEADVAAGDRDAELDAAVLEPAAGLGELPHHARVLGRAEVEAVGDRQRPGAAGRDVAVGLGQRELRAGVRVERGEPAVAVGRHRDPEPGLLVDADHPAVGGLGEHGVAADVAVVLVGDPRLVAEVRAAGQPQQRLAQLVAGRRPRQRLGPVGLQRVLASRAARRGAGRSGRRARRCAAVRRPPARRASRPGAGRCR